MHSVPTYKPPAFNANALHHHHLGPSIPTNISYDSHPPYNYHQINNSKIFHNKTSSYGFHAGSGSVYTPPLYSDPPQYIPSINAHSTSNFYPYQTFNYQRTPFETRYHNESVPIHYENPNFLRGEEEFHMRNSLKGESFIQYIPFEKKIVDHVPVERVEYVPVERSIRDYYAVEKQIDYVPMTRYETEVEYVPQQIIDHIPHTYIEYVPIRKEELVPVQEVQEKVEYQPVDRSIIHYPKVEGQFVEDANKSGRIRYDLAQNNGFVPYQNYNQPIMGRRMDSSFYQNYDYNYNNNNNFYQYNAPYNYSEHKLQYNPRNDYYSGNKSNFPAYGKNRESKWHLESSTEKDKHYKSSDLDKLKKKLSLDSF